ncbi:uncharacterized protein LOC142223924 [Haematobia irritans]|uniref:uncharacterized protein LOC142223924 n=1 Tax=Haematobia irritans TaxID=7368 RepID=UPI003F501AAC
MEDNIDDDDTHMCIRCRQTIVGLENYIQHRKQNCNRNATTTNTPKLSSDHPTTPPSHHGSTQDTPPISYEAFNFPEPEPPSASGHGGKTSKNLGDNYDLAYELGADVFFSSLQLQSVQSSVGQHVAPGQTGGKAGATHHTAEVEHLQRQKSLQSDQSGNEEESWITTEDDHGDHDGVESSSRHHSNENLLNSSDNLLKDTMEEPKKSYESIFTSIAYGHDSPELSEEEEEEDDHEVDVDEPDDDDEDDYDPEAEAHATGGKWKLPLMRHSPPVVPASHTGGKWKPEHRPNLRVAHSQLSRLSPSWDDHMDDIDDGHHPPSDHTKGKWIPGTKVQRLEYKEVVTLAKQTSKQDYWCNICCRKLKSKSIYENHLKTSYHLKRCEPETQLEKAVIQEISQEDINKSFSSKSSSKPSHSFTAVTSVSSSKHKRKRRSTYLRCSLCKHVMNRHMIGKHLISHYHYRRMQLHPGLSLHVILENIHSIVLQSPFQCRPCRFYANTEETFLLHWNSASHLDASEGPGRFWCSYCQFECEDNNQMRRHLLGPEHKEVLLAINRSVPICISKRVSLKCTKCGLGFRYNFELRMHIRQQHPGVEYFGSASDSYQSKFKCLTCPEILPSQIALQRHEKFKHSISKYFCSICSLEFNSPCKARRHRKTLEHKLKSAAAARGGKLPIEKEESQNLHALKADEKEILNPSMGDPILVETTFLPMTDDEVYSTKIDYDTRFISMTTSSDELGWKEPMVSKDVKQSETSSMGNVSLSNQQLEIPSDEQPCTSKQAMKRLKKSQESRKTLKCIHCNEEFQSREQLREHKEKQHSLSQCMICGENFVTAQELGRHSRLCKSSIQVIEGDISTIITEITEQGQFLRKCDLCNFSSSFQSEIIYHRLFHSSDFMSSKDLIKCPLCDKTFRKPSLRCHLRQHTNEKIFECNLCDAKYSRPHNLKDHKERAHGSKKDKEEKEVVRKPTEKKTFQCHNCGKVFKSKQTLHVHCLTHHAAQPEHRFMCPHENCEYGTVNKAQLKVHLVSHSEEMFTCSYENCDYIGKSELHVKRHQKCHLPDDAVKYFYCDKCSFKTKIKGHLRRHMRCHTGEKPYKCQHCDFRTNVQENLRKHVLMTGKHPGKFMYECRLCEDGGKGNSSVSDSNPDIYKTNYLHDYQNHMRRIHNTTYKPGGS